MIITPSLIDVIILAVGGEFLIIALLLRRAGMVDWILPAFWFLASGALLMTALRLALAGSESGMIALPLLGSLFTHLFLIFSVWTRIKKARP
jgi:hypothetical protein